MPRFAAVDIGSNSVRLEVTEVLPGQPWRSLASEKQVTRLGESVFRTGSVSEEALSSLCNVLAGMARTCRALNVTRSRAVATAALRDTTNQAEFVARTSEALESRVEIISGEEEARLVHVGVQAGWPQLPGRVLVVDVGGGSTELILTRCGVLEASWSLPLGAVRLREAFLRHDPPAPAALSQLESHLDRVLTPVLDALAATPPEFVIGTSATAAAVVSATNGIPRTRREDADKASATTARVRTFWDQIRVLDVAARREITGIGAQRAEIIVSGTAVLVTILERLKLPALSYSSAGVRDGIIADLAARQGAVSF